MHPEPGAGRRTGTHRGRWLVAAVVATGVATLFTVGGDGVPPVASGPVGRVVDAGHAVAWVLLAVAAWIATAAGRWTRASAVCALAALGCYLVFLAALLT